MLHETPTGQDSLFMLGVQATSNDYRKEYATMRAAILDAMWTVDGRTRERIIGALNRFQERSDWNFDRD
jgi:hypothetical protein